MTKRKTTIGLIHPKDASHDQSNEFRGQEVLSHSLKKWEDSGWFYGHVTTADGATRYYYKVRLLNE